MFLTDFPFLLNIQGKFCLLGRYRKNLRRLLWMALIIMLIIVFLYSVCKAARINQFVALTLGIFAILAGSFLCFGANLCISRDSYDTRSMYGFNVLLTLMAVFIAFHAKHWIYKAVYAVLTWCFFVFTLTYRNALSL